MIIDICLAEPFTLTTHQSHAHALSVMMGPVFRKFATPGFQLFLKEPAIHSNEPGFKHGHPGGHRRRRSRSHRFHFLSRTHPMGSCSELLLLRAARTPSRKQNQLLLPPILALPSLHASNYSPNSCTFPSWCSLRSCCPTFPFLPQHRLLHSHSNIRNHVFLVLLCSRMLQPWISSVQLDSISSRLVFMGRTHEWNRNNK